LTQATVQALLKQAQAAPDSIVLRDALAVAQFQQQDYAAALANFQDVLRLSQRTRGNSDDDSAVEADFTAWPAWAHSAWSGVASKAANLKSWEQWQALIWRNIGACHLCLIQPQQAEHAYAQAHALAPEDVASTLYYLVQCMANCEWSQWQALSDQAVSQVLLAQPHEDLSASIALFGAAPQAAHMRSLAAQVGKSIAHTLDEAHIKSSIALRADASSSRLRVGYFSCDFRSHSVGQLTQSMFGLHDRSAVEVFALSYGADDGGAVRQNIAQGAEHFVELRGLSALEMVQRIRALQLDIVIDLSGHTAGALPQVMHYRVAPIQCHWLGYLWSMGSAAYDYLIADVFSAPEQFHAHYQEAVVQLPHSLQITPSHWPAAAQSKSREDLGLRDDAMVLAYFGILSKIQPPMFDAWLRVLKAVPKAVLWIARTAHSSAEAFGRLRLRSMLAGVNPAQIMFSDPVPHAEHLARYELVDVALDPFPVGSGVTALEALWMGCPMVSMAAAGETLVSRMPGAVLQSAGLADWVVDRLEAYEALLLQLARDRNRCTAARAHLLAQQASLPVFDTRARVRQLESAYLRMMEAALAARQPQSFAVSS
jgi:protein O-GlcNAc transferase